MTAAANIGLVRRFDVIADSRGDWGRGEPWLRKRSYWSTTYSRVTVEGEKQTVQVRLRHDVFVGSLALHCVAGQLRVADILDRAYPDRRSRPALRRRR